MRTKEDIFAILAAMYDLCSVIKPTKDPGSWESRNRKKKNFIKKRTKLLSITSFKASRKGRMKGLESAISFLIKFMRNFA